MRPTPPFGVELARAIAQVREDADEPAAPVLVLGRTERAARAAEHALLHAGGSILVRFGTLELLTGDAPGWRDAVVASALRSSERALPHLDDRLGRHAVRATVARLDDAGVTAEALRTLPGDDLDRPLLDLLAELLVALRAGRSGGTRPAPDAVVLLAPLGARDVPGEAVGRCVRAPRPAPSASVSLLRAARRVGEHANRAHWRQLLLHPALALGGIGASAAAWSGLLAGAQAGDAGSLVLEILQAAPRQAPEQQEAAADLVAALRELDEATRANQSSGTLGEHAARRAGFLRRWGRPSADRAAVLAALDRLSATTGPRLGAALADEVLEARLDAAPPPPLLAARIAARIERACGVRLAPVDGDGP